MVNFDAVIRGWLDAHPEDRDPAEGALLLLRIDRNKVAYNAALANPARYLPRIEQQLRLHLARRAAVPSDSQVVAMVAEAEKIVHKNDTAQIVAAQIKAGKRADHDSLPEEIRNLYVENLELKRRRSQYHTQIQILRKSKADCSKEDIRDLVELLKKTDIRYRQNWKKYDAYGK